MVFKESRFFHLTIVFLIHAGAVASLKGNNIALEESDNNFFLQTERAVPELWYSRLLELSMHVWADFDMLQRGSSTLLPDHLELVFDASIGKLVHLNWCLDQMIHHKKGVIAYNDVCYFVQIMQSVYKNCIEIVTRSSLENKIESTREILRGIMTKIEVAFSKECD